MVFALTARVNRMAFQQFPEAQVIAIAPPAVPGMGTTGGLEFIAEDSLGRSHAEMAIVLNDYIAAANEDTALQGVFSTFRANVPQYFVDIDRVKAKTLGVSLDSIFSSLQAQLGSMYINDFNKFGQTYQVIMQAEAEYRQDITDLQTFQVRNGQGEMAPLSTLMTIKPILGPDRSIPVSHYKGISSAWLQFRPGYCGHGATG